MSNQFERVIGALMSGLTGTPSQISARLGLKGPSVRRVLGDLLSQGLAARNADGTYAQASVAEKPSATVGDILEVLTERGAAAHENLIERLDSGRAAVGAWGALAGRMPLDLLEAVESPSRRKLTLGDIDRALSVLVVAGRIYVDSEGVYAATPKVVGTIATSGDWIARVWAESPGYRFFVGPKGRRRPGARSTYNYDEVHFTSFKSRRKRGGLKNVRTAMGSVGGQTVPLFTVSHDEYIVVDWDKKRNEVPADVLERIGPAVAIQKSRNGGLHIFYDRKNGNPPADIWSMQDRTYEKLARKRGIWGVRCNADIERVY